MKKHFAKNILLPFHEWAFKRPTFRMARELEQTQWLPSEEIEQVQHAKLAKLLQHCRQSVPYYQSCLAAEGREVQSVTDIAAFPLLDKERIRRNFEAMLSSKKIPADLSNTGGSSGEPLIFWLDRNRQAAEKAHRIRTHKWWGVAPGDREFYLWGAPAELKKQDRLKQLRDWLINEKLLSAFDMTEESMCQYLQIIKSSRPACLFGYPSSFALLCQFVVAQGLQLRNIGLKAIFCTGEVLYDHQRQLISETFGVPVANGYGARDAGFIAHECPAGKMHIAAEHVIVEILDESGQSVPKGEVGEIVITNLDGYAMPFIRYKTGDLGALADEQCPCGRGLPLMKVIQGRTTDFIVTENGGKMHALGLIYVLREMQGIRQFQIIQKEIDRVEVLIVRNGQFPGNGDATITNAFKKRVGQNTIVKVHFVDDIPVAKSGKYRYVISEVAD